MRRDKYALFVFVFLSLLLSPKRGMVEGSSHSSDGHADTPTLGEARPWEESHLGKESLIKWILLGAPPMLPDNMAL